MERTRQTRTRETAFSVREEGGGKRIEGYFAVFGSVYDMGGGITETIDPHAFDETLGDDIRALIDHEPRLVLGRTSANTLRLRVDEHGLWSEIDVNPNDTDAMNLYARVQRGDVTQCSFGFDILEEEKEYGPGPGEVRFIIKRVRLYEVSCVTFPAYRETEISARMEQAQTIRKRQAQTWREKRKERLCKWRSDR